MRGLNAPPRRAVAPAALTALAVVEDLLFALDRARTGDHADRAAADRQAAGADDRRLLLHFAAGDLVGGQDRQHFGHARAAFERFLVHLAIVADRGDHGPLGADDHVGFEPEALDPLDHVLDVGWVAFFFMTTITAGFLCWAGVQENKKPREPAVRISGLWLFVAWWEVTNLHRPRDPAG